MPRRKSADYHFRCDPDNKREWESEGQRQGMSLAMWFECIANREVLARRRARLLRQM
jgi:hypothetical protein